MTSALLLIAALLFAAAFTKAAVRTIDSIRPDWPLWLKLALASFVPPITFVLFVGGVLALAGGLPKAFSSSYALHDVFINNAVKLWLCGAICVAAIGYARLHSSNAGSTGLSKTTTAALVRTTAPRFNIEKTVFRGLFIGIIIGFSKVFGLWTVLALGLCGGYFYQRALLRRAGRR